MLAKNKAADLPKAYLDQLGFHTSHLVLYPLVLNIALLPSIIDTTVAVYIYPPPYWLMVLEIGISHSIGFINAVMYIHLRKLYQPLSKQSDSSLTGEYVRDFTSDSESVTNSFARGRETNRRSSFHSANDGLY